ncbi:MAG TPA: hypothetical protein VLH19_01350 [Patescibacteria group bacterium]|nr:hypothetical protein [Patescibacteria group bacterium]
MSETSDRQKMTRRELFQHISSHTRQAIDKSDLSISDQIGRLANSHEGKPKFKKKGVSRRQVLKGALIATLEGTLRPVGRIIEGINQLARRDGSEMEGNLLLFTARLEEMLQDYIRDFPNLDERKHQIIEAYIKFYAASKYASASEKQLAGNFVTHFLFGDGREYSLGVDYEQALSKFLQSLDDNTKAKLGITETMNLEDALRIFTQEALSDHALTNKMHRTEGTYVRSADDSSQYFVGHDLKSLAGQKIHFFSVVYSRDPEIMNSLGQFTVEADSIVREVNDGKIILDRVTVRVVDQYDWKVDPEFGAVAQMSQIVRETGLEELFNNDLLKPLLDIKFEIMDGEGELLEEAGYASNFPIRGEYALSSPLVIRLTQASALPDDFHPEAGEPTVTNLDS